MILTKSDFPKGSVVACKHSGNKARYDKGYTLGWVKSAVNKLVTIAFNEEGNNTAQFHLDDRIERDYLIQKSNVIGNYELFPSEQAYLDYEEKIAKLFEIKPIISPFSGDSSLSIDQVRRIYDIAKE